MKKNMKPVLAVVIIFLCISVCVPAKSAEAGTYKGFSYSLIGNNRVRVDGYDGKKKTVTTPKKIKGKKVTEIGEMAFANNYRIKKLIISEGVEKIGDRALHDMQSLKSVSFPMTLKKITKSCGVNSYSEASDFPSKSYTVIKGSPAFKFVTKKLSASKIHVKKTKKVVLWFSANGGDTVPAARIVRKGNKYKKLPISERENYKFLGWYTKKKGGKKITAKTKATKNATVFAHWESAGKNDNDLDSSSYQRAEAE